MQFHQGCDGGKCKYSIGDGEAQTAELKIPDCDRMYGTAVKDEIFDEIPEIDACLGTSSFDKILDVIEELKARDGIEDAEEISVYDDIDRLATITESNKVITSGTFMGYLKIAEGCDKFCTYCVIPHIRGHYRSVPMEQLLKEAEYMASQGIEELVLVAQETSHPGRS